MSVLWLIASVITCIFVYYLCDYRFGSGRYWQKRGVPCMDGALPIIGHMWPLVSVRESFIFMYNRFYEVGPNTSMFGVYNFRQPILIVREPSIIKTILLSAFNNFDDNASKLDPDLDPLLSTNPFYSYGEQWKSQRTIFHSALTNKQLRIISLQLNDVCSKFITYLNAEIAKSGGLTAVDTQKLLSRFTAEVVATCAFGIDGRSFTQHPRSFYRIAQRMFEPSRFNEFIGSIALFFPFLRRLFRISFMPRQVDQYFRSVLKDVVALRAESNVPVSDFLQQIIDAKPSQKLIRDEDFVPGHAAGFFLDGYITSSLTMGFASYYVATHPQVQERIRSEVTDVLKRYEGRITFEALQDMRYLEQVINEAMRLFPVLGYIGKVCTKECELVGSDGLRCLVEPGTEIIIPVIALQRDPKYWDRSETFDPERFDEARKKDQDKFAFIPFGGGPRMCLGMRVAMLQMKAAIATLVRRFSIEVDARTEEPVAVNPMSALFTIAENELWIRIKTLQRD